MPSNVGSSPLSGQPVRLFAQLPDDAAVKCRGLQRSRVHALAAVAAWADRRTHTAWLSLSRIAEACGMHRGTASRARADLAEVGALEVVGRNRRGAWLVRLCFRSAARAHPTQSPAGTKPKTPRTILALQGLAASRIKAVVQGKPSVGEDCKRRAAWSHNMTGTPVGAALYDALCDAATPGWRGSAADLLKRGVSRAMADALARAFSSLRVGSVVEYCDRKRYREGAIVAALLHAWSTG